MALLDKGEVEETYFPNKYFPAWFSKTNYSAEELEYIIEQFVSEVLNANDNKNKVDVFNVINEIFAIGKSGKYRVSGDEKEDCKWMDMGFEKDMSGLEGEQKINDDIESILLEDTDDSTNNEINETSDELYNEAVSIVKETKKTSISFLQRKLKIGYNRAANLIEAMESRGILSEPQSNGNRDIL